MPAYSSSPFGPFPALLVPGTSGYSWGSFSDQNPTTKLFVKRSSSNGSATTLTVQVWEGPVPSVQQLVSTQGLGNVTNVTNVAVASRTGFGDLTNGTITYADTVSGSAVIADDPGLALLPAQEIGETIPGGASPPQSFVAVAGAAFALASLQEANARSVAWGVSFPSNPPSTTFEADLQGAMENVEAQYFSVDKITATGGGTQTYHPVAQLNFLRVKIVSADNAGTGTIIAKISI